MASGGLPHQPLPAAAFLAHFGKDSLGYSNAGPLDSRGPVVAALPQIEIHPRHIVPDERDAFISWLRGEFAAANAIIDAMCHHLCMVGEPSEYDFVFTCIQQRRYNWTLVLHMQQFFSVAEVIYALQQATWRKQQVRSANQPLMQQTVHRSMEEFKDTQTPNILRGLKGEAPALFPQPEGSVPDVSASMNRDLSPGDSSLSQEVSSSKGMQTPVPRVDDLGASQSLPRSGLDSIEQSTDLVFPDLAHRMISESSEGQEAHTDAENEGYTALSKSPGSYGGKLFNADFTALSKEEQDARLRMVKVSKHFQCWEHVEGNLINVVEGLELYENVLNNYETSQLAYLITEIQAAGRRGELRGKTFIVDKRITGSPKETIQFGHGNNHPPGELTEPMPVVLNTAIDRLIQWHILPASKRPDYCSVNVLEEGEESPLFVHHQRRLDQYFCCFFLMDECTLVMGHNLSMDNGDHKNRFKLLLPSGSALLLQGHSADVASRAVLASPGRRIIVTFGKLLGSKVSDVYPVGGKFAHSATTNTAPTLTATAWLPVGLHGGAAGVHGIVPATMKHYGTATAPGVLPIPSVRPLLHSPHHFPQHLAAATPGSVQAVITSPTGPARVYPPLGVMSQGWSAVPPRAPRPPNNGTGVFFPSSGSSGGSPGQPLGPSQMQAGVITVSQLSQKPEPFLAFAPSTTDSSNNFGCPPSRVLRSSTLTDQSDLLVERPESFSSFNSLGSNEPILPRKATCKEPANPGLKSEANSNNRNIKEEQLQQQRVFHPSNKAGGGKI